MKKFKCNICSCDQYGFTQIETYPKLFSEPIEISWEIGATPSYQAVARCLSCSLAWRSSVSIEDLNAVMIEAGVLT